MCRGRLPAAIRPEPEGPTTGRRPVPNAAIVVFSPQVQSKSRAMANKSQYVVPRGDKWAVRKEGSIKVTRRFDAISAARVIARKQRADLVIFGWDGRIRERELYGNDSLRQHG